MRNVSLLVDLEKHAVLEASAGTGKTYNLEELVLRLLTEKQVRLDQILLVTYTEKATGELKGRLRERLETSLRDENADLQPLLRTALDQFDQTSIFTIHGFCQRVLQEFAFEQGQDFRPHLVSDRTLLKSCLREVQRREWWRRYGKQLRNVLEMANYQGKAGLKWERNVLQIAEQMRPACGHRLSPQPLENWLEQTAKLDDMIRDKLSSMRNLSGTVTEPVHEHCWYVGYGQLTYAHRETQRCDILLPVMRWLASAESNTQPLASFLQLVCQLPKKSRIDQLVKRLPAKDKKNIEELCPRLDLALSMVQDLADQIDCDLQSHQLAAHTIHELQQHLTDAKRERGLQSFEDMIVRVHDGLDRERNPGADALVQMLRERYRYAIVDEFQDTDPLQWRIFKRIFVDGSDNRLFVVGDPKQAIFGFRGADLPTYVAAVNQLQNEHTAGTHELTVNWRSTPELLHALNHVFDKGKWFEGDDGLKYTRVEAAPAEAGPIQVRRDDSERASLSLVELTARKLSQAQRAFGQFVADEIGRLLSGPASALEFTLKARPSTLDASDFCVLVFRKREAVPVIDALTKAGIPYSFYKQTGLWQSDQAVHLGYVLRAIARPEDTAAFHKALLTRLFRFEPKTLATADAWPVDHAARELFQEWVSFAERRQWGRLFQSLLEDSGLIFHEANEKDAERRLANYRHIFTCLEQAAYGQNLDLFELVESFEQKTRQAGDEAELQPIETDQPKVRIMTIHAAKGLEFPVVFLAGGLTQKYVTGDRYRDADGNMVFDLAPDHDAKELAKRDRLAEDRRLLYVAMTRAVIKMYLPWPQVEKPIMPGPVVSILNPAIEASGAATLGIPWVGVVKGEPGASATGVDRSKPSVTPVTDAPGSPMISGELFPRIDANPWQRRIVIRSFSSLHREKTARSAVAASYGDEPKRETDDEPRTPDAADALRGPVFGDIVHNVIEQFDFALAGAATEPAVLVRPGHPFRVLLDDELRKNALNLPARISRPALDDACRKLVSELVWKTLRTPLQDLGCALWQIPKADLLPEVEFHFPEAFGDELPPGVQRDEGFLTGFMDLVLRRGGRYFLLDWKSNLLPDYTPDDVARSMLESDYVRQYRLYVHALSRWLKRVQPDFDYERDFGGVYYLYLRGMNGTDEGSGVHFCKPTADEVRLRTILA